VSKLLELHHTQQDKLASSVEFSMYLIPCISCKTGFPMCTFLYIKGMSIHSSSFLCSQLLAGQWVGWYSETNSYAKNWTQL